VRRKPKAPGCQIRPHISARATQSRCARRRQESSRFRPKSTIRVAADGTWFHCGSPINRAPLVQLFASIMRKEGDRYGLTLLAPRRRVGEPSMIRIAISQAAFEAIARTLPLGSVAFCAACGSTKIVALAGSGEAAEGDRRGQQSRSTSVDGLPSARITMPGPPPAGVSSTARWRSGAHGCRARPATIGSAPALPPPAIGQVGVGNRVRTVHANIGQRFTRSVDRCHGSSLEGWTSRPAPSLPHQARNEREENTASQGVDTRKSLPPLTPLEDEIRRHQPSEKRK
jgi:hypothetical protein